MTRFEDNLWRELAGTHGPELSDADGPLQPRSRLRAPLVAGTSVGVIGGVAAAVIVLTAGSAAPAFAVTSHKDGTVSVVIRRIDGIPGANRRLKELRIRARAVQVAAGCWAHTARPAAGVPIMTLATGRHKNWVTATPSAIHAQFRPTAIPKGRTLVLPAVRAGAVVRLVHARVVSGAIPKCLPPAVQVRTPATRGKVQIISCRAGITSVRFPARPGRRRTRRRPLPPHPRRRSPRSRRHRPRQRTRTPARTKPPPTEARRRPFRAPIRPRYRITRGNPTSSCHCHPG